jgi:hypothetical protein
MSFLPIPQEAIEKAVKTTKRKVISQIRGKLKNQNDLKETKIFKKTCLTMSEYLISGGNFEIDRVDALINGMHRSILYLQKRKIDMRKKNKGNNRG